MILDVIPTDPMWAEAISITALSGAVGRRMEVMSFGGLGLNLFYIAIGPSRLGYKTLPLNKFLIPTLADLERDFPSSFTIEGLIEFIHKNNRREGVIVRDEASTIFKEPKYNESMMEFMSQIYSNRMYKRYTKKSKLEDAGVVNISFIGATTPYVYQVLKREHFIQGLGNRVIWIMLTNNNKELAPMDLFTLDDKIIETEDRRMELTDFLRSITSLDKKVFIVPTKDSGVALTDFKNDCTKRAFDLYTQNSLDLMSPYYGSMSEFALKLSALKTVSRKYPDHFGDNDIELEISKDDAEWGINKTLQYKNHFKSLIHDWQIRAVDTPVETQESVIEFVLDKCRKAVVDEETGEFKLKDVVSLTGMYNSKLVPILETLAVRGDIIIKNRGGSKRKYRVFFYNPKNMNKSSKN